MLSVILGTLFVALPSGHRPAVAAQTVCPTPTTLTNGDFETPVIPEGTYKVMPQTQVPGWLTTASDNAIELWHEMTGNKYNAPDAAVGTQYAELNANLVSTLYQELPTVPGETLRWELRHRGRLGTDTMGVWIGPANSEALGVKQGPDIVDTNTAWGSYSGMYTVPAAQFTTRFAFRSISAAQNKPTHGNFLDAISFGTSACLTTTTSVSPASANIGDTLTYTVAARNDGGNPARSSVLTDTLPAGVRFVPGSIRSITGSASTTVSDAADGDTGEYDAATRTVRVRSGDGAGAAAGGTVQPGETRSLSYQVTVDTATADSTVTNDATATYTDTLTGNRPTSVSNTIPTVVAPAADLSVTAVLTSSGVVAGQRAEITATATNTGRNTAGTVRLAATVPPGLTGIGASSPNGTCAISGQVATCDIATLPVGGTVTMRVAADVPSAATVGTQAVLPVTISSATYEMSAANNSASVSAAVTAIGDLGVTMTASPSAPVAGDTVTYTIPVTNTGPSMMRSIGLSDPVATGNTYVGSGVSGGNGGACAYTVSARIVECGLGPIDANVTVTVTIVIRLSPSVTAVNNAVSVVSLTPDANVGNNNASVQSAGTAVADVAVSLTIGASTAYAGESVPYTLTVTNNGPSEATNVSFNTVVPPGVTIVRPAFCTATACTLDKLDPGETRTLEGLARLGWDAQAGVGRATTTVISPTTDTVAANDTDTVTFTILLSGDASVTQTISNPGGGVVVAGQSLRSAVVVANSGPTRAEGVVVRQAVPAGWEVPSASAPGGTCVFQTTGAWSVGTVTTVGGVWDCTRTVLAAGSFWNVTFEGLLPASYAGAWVTRVAEVTTSSPDPAAGNDTATGTATVHRRSDLGIVQSLTTVPPIVQSEQVRFRATVSNAGPSDARQVIIRDEPQTGLSIVSGVPGSGSYSGSTWTIPVLATGATAILDFTGTAQGSGALTGRITILSSESTDPAAANDTATVSMTVAAAAPALGLVVTPAVSPPGNQDGVRAGDSISYQYAIRNTGNLTMTQIGVTGSKGGAATCPQSTLAAGAGPMICTAGPYPVVQSDIDSRLPVTDTVRVVAAAPGATGATQYGLVTASVPIAVAADLLTVLVTPTVSPAARQSAVAEGDTIDYAFTVANNGGHTMSSIAVTDSLLGPISCPTSLAVGASAPCTPVTHTVTQAQIDAGVPIASSATATGVPAGGTLTSYGPYTSAVAVEMPAPVLTLDVDPQVSGRAGAGDPINYAYEITNDGNVTISGLAVVDTIGGAADCHSLTTVAVSATVTCHSAAPYRVTQDDVDTGADIRNNAVVTGQGAGTGNPPASAQMSVPVRVAVAAPDLSIRAATTVDPADHAGGVEAGDVVTAQYLVTNTGNVTMRDVSVVSDPVPASCPRSTLAVAAAMYCATPRGYPVSRADVDAGGPLSFSGAAHGRQPSATQPIAYATTAVTVPVAEASGLLTVTVTPSVTPAAHADAVEPGDRIGYTYLIRNAGNVTMSRITLTSGRFGPIPCPGTSVPAGDTMTCAAPSGHTVTRADVAAGKPVIENAVLTAQTPGATAPADFGPFTSEIPVLVPAPSLTIETAGTVQGAGARRTAGIRSTVEASAGDTVAWTYLVTNNGNTAMGTVTVVTALGRQVRCPSAGLAVRAAMTCTAAAYPVVQAHVDTGGGITETAYVTGIPDGETDPGRYGPSAATVPVVAGTPALTLAVTAVTSRAGVQAGDTVGFRYQVTNDGDVTMTDVAVASAMFGAGVCPPATLAVRATVVCTTPRPHRVSQAEMDAGSAFRETARVIGTRPGREPVSFRHVSVTVPLAEARPVLAAAQTATWTDVDGDGVLGVTDDVTSTVVVTNTGNVTVTALRISGLPTGVTCTPTTLAPGEQAVCVSGVYHLTRQEIVSGRRTYEARATGSLTRADAADEVEATAPATVVTPRRPDPSTSPPPGARPDIPVTGDPAVVLALTGVGMLAAGALLLATAHTRPPGRHRSSGLPW
ncbi:hypothetical protein GCM10025331_77620 [Actinoplanes utahensis]|nr:hypothetical protein Aut01nite_80800 [Actinoplanes utahensis]